MFFFRDSCSALPVESSSRPLSWKHKASFHPTTTTNVSHPRVHAPEQCLRLLQVPLPWAARSGKSPAVSTRRGPSTRQLPAASCIRGSHSLQAHTAKIPFALLLLLFFLLPSNSVFPSVFPLSLNRFFVPFVNSHSPSRGPDL